MTKYNASDILYRLLKASVDKFAIIIIPTFIIYIVNMNFTANSHNQNGSANNILAKISGKTQITAGTIGAPRLSGNISTGQFTVMTSSNGTNSNSNNISKGSSAAVPHGSPNGSKQRLSS